jgi:hypothetical protein
MKLLLDENQVGVINGGEKPMIRMFTGVGNLENRELVEIQGMVQPERGQKPVIGFPNVVSCQGVLCVMSNGALIGGHVPLGGKIEKDMLSKMRDLINENGGAEQISQMYVASNSKRMLKQNGGSLEEKAQALGFKGPVRHYDISKGENVGTYVQMTPMSDKGKCLVEYKNEKKMVYENKVGLKTTDSQNKVRDAHPKVGAELYGDSKHKSLNQAKTKKIHL